MTSAFSTLETVRWRKYVIALKKTLTYLITTYRAAPYPNPKVCYKVRYKVYRRSTDFLRTITYHVELIMYLRYVIRFTDHELYLTLSLS